MPYEDTFLLTIALNFVTLRFTILLLNEISIKF